MKNINIYLISFVTICILTACNKNTPEPSEPPEPPEEPTLTEATMEGKHTLSFLLDGEVWVSDRGWGDLGATVSIGGKTFLVSASNDNEDIDDNFTFSMNLESFVPKYYTIDSTLIRCILGRSQELNGCSYRYEQIQNDSFNFVDIKWIDNENRYISGTFQFRIVDQISGCTDTMHLTEGRFDLQFQSIP